LPPKNQFLEKSDPLTEKFRNLATKGLTAKIHVFLLLIIIIIIYLPRVCNTNNNNSEQTVGQDSKALSFVEISRVEVTKRVHGIHHEKSWYFDNISVASGAISPKILYE